MPLAAKIADQSRATAIMDQGGIGDGLTQTWGPFDPRQGAGG